MILIGQKSWSDKNPYNYLTEASMPNMWILFERKTVLLEVNGHLKSIEVVHASIPSDISQNY